MFGDTIEQTFKVSGPVNIRISNTSGKVEVQTGDDQSVHVVALKHSERKYGERTSVELKQNEDGSISMATRYDDPILGWMLGNQVCDVDYLVTAPRSSNLVVNTVSATIQASGFDGDLEFKSISGELTLTELSGKVKAETVSGDVIHEKISGEANIKSISGNMQLNNSNLHSLRLGTISGNAFIQTVFEPSGQFHFESVSGDIHLQLPGQTQCSIEMHTISGEILINDPAARVTRSGGSFHAVLGAGGVPVSMNSVSGNLIIQSQGMDPRAGVPDNEVNSAQVIDRLEKGEISVDEAVAQLNG